MCEELFDTYQRDRADEDGTWSKVRQNWMGHDEMDVWVYLKRKTEEHRIERTAGIKKGRYWYSSV